MYSHSTNLNALCDSYASFEAKWEEEDGDLYSAYYEIKTIIILLFSLLWNKNNNNIIIALHN